MPIFARWLVAVATTVLTLAIIAVLALGAVGGPVGTVASPVPSAPPVESRSAQPSASEDPLTVFAEIERQVRDIRGLPAAEIGPPEIVTRAQLSDELQRIFDEDYPPDERAADNAALRALGLLGAGQDIGALTEQLYAAQVLGFYDFDERRMVVVTDTGLDAEARITYAHEYTHALQDAAFDTGAAHEALVGEDDAATARLGLEEGDATVAMLLWGLANLQPDELLDISETPIPDMAGIPDWMVRQLQLPYLAGAEFVGSLYAGGLWDAVNEAYADPPVSTEQLLHPEKYASREAPVPVAGVDLAGGLSQATGEDWSAAETTTLGEAMIGIWLGGIGADLDVADAAAAGWGGDSLSVAGGPSDAWAMTLSVAWDSQGEADEFVDAYSGLAGSLPFAARVERVGPRRTVVVHASSGELLRLAQGVATR